LQRRPSAYLLLYSLLCSFHPTSPDASIACSNWLV
jgi:hypothetical protein